MASHALHQCQSMRNARMLYYTWVLAFPLEYIDHGHGPIHGDVTLTTG